jgi:hypothetical protein
MFAFVHACSRPWPKVEAGALFTPDFHVWVAKGHIKWLLKAIEIFPACVRCVRRYALMSASVRTVRTGAREARSDARQHVRFRGGGEVRSRGKPRGGHHI